MAPLPQDPIVISASPTKDQLATAGRDLLKVIGSAIATKGIIDSSLVDPFANAVWVFGGAGLALWPIIWSQFKTRSNHVKLWWLAHFAPNSIGQAEPKK